MTKFETIGIEYLNSAIGMHEVNKMFNTSCKICCTRGMKIDCANVQSKQLMQ